MKRIELNKIYWNTYELHANIYMLYLFYQLIDNNLCELEQISLEWCRLMWSIDNYIQLEI